MKAMSTNNRRGTRGNNRRTNAKTKLVEEVSQHRLPLLPAPAGTPNMSRHGPTYNPHWFQNPSFVRGGHLHVPSPPPAPRTTPAPPPTIASVKKMSNLKKGGIAAGVLAAGGGAYYLYKRHKSKA